MKTLLLVRHAKSSWDFDVDDFDRPLNERGKRDAPQMAGRLLEKQVKIDAFVSSPAKRALSTARFFAEAYDEKKSNIITLAYLYEPTYQAFRKAVEALPENLLNVAIFSHNPGITEFANGLSGVKIDDMPTCAVYAVKANVNKWVNFMDAEKEFLFFDYPKNL